MLAGLAILLFFAAGVGLVWWSQKRQDAAYNYAKDKEAIAEINRRRAEDAEKQRDVHFSGSERDLVDRMLDRSDGASRGDVPEAADNATHGGASRGTDGSR